MEYRYLEQHVRYILELGLRDYACLQFRPSTLAAGCLLLSRFILSGSAGSWCGQWVPHRLWGATTQHYTFHSAAALKPCVQHLHQLLLQDHKTRNTFLFKKYAERRRKCVAKFAVPALDERIFGTDFSCPVPSNWFPRGY